MLRWGILYISDALPRQRLYTWKIKHTVLENLLLRSSYLLLPRPKNAKSLREGVLTDDAIDCVVIEAPSRKLLLKEGYLFDIVVLLLFVTSSLQHLPAIMPLQVLGACADSVGM